MWLQMFQVDIEHNIRAERVLMFVYLEENIAGMILQRLANGGESALSPYACT